MMKINLEGEWKLKQAGCDNEFPVLIPGDNFSALIDAGKIPHPYNGRNELLSLWVGRADWSFSRSFPVDQKMLEKMFFYLHIDSLDTCGEVRINGSTVTTSCNMFRAIRVDVNRFLKPGKNTIEIVIRAPENVAKERSLSLPYEIPHTLYPVQSMHSNLLRKTQCNSGWDWGPCLMVSGLYGKTCIGVAEDLRLDHVYAETVLRSDGWDLRVTAEFTSYIDGAIGIDISLQDLPDENGGEVPVLGQFKESTRVTQGTNIVTRTLHVDSPRLWWPAGYGEQPLYTLVVKAGSDETRKRIGFRTIEVIAEDDEIGRSMTFRVNGKEIFCKGANWIPADALPALESRQRFERLLSDAVAANMNMLRVWGGGKYEPDVFYDLCDEKGILLWHDFMFSCALYPASEGFLREVEEEVAYQVKRLLIHPCIALWCGNNECLGALTWFEVSKANRDRYLVDYDRLYEGVVARIVKEIDPGRTWWSSSPSGGPSDYSDCWHNDARGDMHYWSVWHEAKPFEAYYDVTPRFCSEFGFQSFPSMAMIRSFANEDQLNLTSPVLEHHQRHPLGNMIIITTMCRYFRFPEKLEHFIYVSQVQQAMAMRMAVEYWRSRRPVCMGALYWQLNDVWPVVSWSSIEYSGTWKLLHYAAKRFFDPVHLSVYIKEDHVQVWGINDRDEALSGTFTLEFMDFRGKVLDKKESAIRLGGEAATELLNRPLSEIPFEREKTFLRARFISSGLERENNLLLTVPKACDLAVPDIDIRVTGSGGELEIVLKTDKPAFYVTLSSGNIPGVFSDNCFTLFPGKVRTLQFFARESVAPAELEKALVLYHLRKTYR